MASKVASRSSDVQDRLRFESMLADLSLRFVNLEPAEVDRKIGDAQRRVCECLGLDISALWQLSPEEPGVLRMTHLYRSTDGPPVPDNFDARQYNPWALGRVLEGEAVLLPRVDAAPTEAVTDRETWRYFGINSVFCIPLSTGGESAIGAVSFHHVREECAWAEDIIQRLQLVSQIFANALVRKRTDAALRESEERLKLAAEAADVGMWMLDVANQRFWATDGAREIFGYAAETDVTMDVFMESVHPSCRESVAEAVRRAAEEGREVDIEYKIVLPNGDERWVHSRGRMQPASATAPVRLLGVSIDSTERKHSEDELRQSYEELKRLRDQLEIENAYLQEEHRLQHGSGRIVGESPAIMEVLRMAEQVAPGGTTVLVEGETGTGKELIAQRIHELSPRKDRPMLKVNCAALPSTLVESELFGREKGAYTGAVSREPGRFEVASGSTIFLDEIAELPFELQSKLLRVLEEGQFERVGSSKTMRTDVRVIAATNRDLRAEVEEGRFRRDLFFRLNVFPIRVPPLRERRGDVPLLVWAIVQELSSGMNKAVETIRREDMERLQRYDWPGNVRELRNVVERAMILCSGPKLRIELPTGPTIEDSDDGVGLSMDEVQRRHILRVLEAAGGRIRGSGGAAELLGLKPTTLRSRMQRLGIDPRRLRDEQSSS
jgi:formate hydrogenlyase transcriptional activator